MKSPGLRHKHYSPKARVHLIDADAEIDSKNAAFIGITEPASRYSLKLRLPDASAYAHSVFEFFRECDRRAIGDIYCERIDEQGIGAALMDRLRRAAQG